jgi:hypothetical protein
MKKTGTTRIERGQAITFRLPSDTPDHIIKKLQTMKEKERRNFSSSIAELVLEGVNKSLSKERETITIPLPKPLNKEQRNWLRHSHSEALLGNVIHHLLVDPIRATSVLASLNSSALDINEALFLQEHDGDDVRDVEPVKDENKTETEVAPESIGNNSLDELEDDLMNFDWETARQETDSLLDEIEVEEDKEALLGSFLSHMNK